MSFWSNLLARFGKAAEQEQQAEAEESNELQEIEARLRKLQTRERRQAQLLERMHQELGTKLDSIQTRLNQDLPLETIFACAESLALYRLKQESDPALEQIWARFTQLLDEFEMQLILDQGQEFNDARHQACDTRWVPEAPTNTILEVVRPGLILQGRITRPAVVVINSPEQGQQASHVEQQTAFSEQT